MWKFPTKPWLIMASREVFNIRGMGLLKCWDIFQQNYGIEFAISTLGRSAIFTPFYGKHSFGHLSVISTNKTPFIECIIPLKTSYN